MASHMFLYIFVYSIVLDEKRVRFNCLVYVEGYMFTFSMYLFYQRKCLIFGVTTLINLLASVHFLYLSDGNHFVTEANDYHG